jgi:hypothetical protein
VRRVDRPAATDRTRSPGDLRPLLLGSSTGRDQELVGNSVLFDLGADPELVGGEVLRLRSGDTWEEGGWAEPMVPDSTPPPAAPPGPLRATAVRAVVEVALLAAAAKAREEDRPVDLGDLLLALTEGWPRDLVARALAELQVDEDRLREAVNVARRRSK